MRLQNQDLAPHHLAIVVERRSGRHARESGHPEGLEQPLDSRLLGNDDDVVVRPQSARHLVSVNGRAIQKATRLADGDVIAAGDARLRYLDDSRSPSVGRQFPDESAWLRTLDGAVAYTLARRTLHIGRDAGSNIQLKDPDVSRHHADVRGEAGLHVLHSMGALGTTVNSDPVEQARVLHEGDRIDIGEDAFIYTRTRPEKGTRITSGGEEYDLEVSRQLTGRQRKLMDSPGKALNNPRVLRVVAVIVAVMAVVLVVLLFAV